MPSAPDPAAPRPATCKNCGSTRVAEWCADCGQRNVEMRVPARALVLDAVEDGLSLDSRIGRTVWPFLFRPGFLTEEWCAGRRTRYSAPLRMFLLASAVFFVAAGLIGGEGSPVRLDTGPGDGAAATAEPAGADRGDVKQAQAELDEARIPLDLSASAGKAEKGLAVTPGTEAEHAELRSRGWLGRRLDDRWRELSSLSGPEVKRRVGAAFREWVPRVTFFLVPAAVLILAALWRRRWLSEHVVLSLHLHAFAFTIFTALLALRLLPWKWPREALGPVFFLWLAAWYVLALRRVYGEPWRWTLPKAALAALLYVVALGLGMAGVGALALWFA